MEVTSPVVDKGQTALVRQRPQGADKLVIVNGKEYLFREINGVSLSWVDNEDVGAVFELRIECCGGQRRQEFQYANSAQESYWRLCGGKRNDS